MGVKLLRRIDGEKVVGCVVMEEVVDLMVGVDREMVWGKNMIIVV